MRVNFLLLFWFFATSTAMAQPYTPLLDHFNEWQLTNCFFGCVTDVYYTDGDTIVNGQTHKILDGYHYISRTFLLREEVASKKVYLTRINPGGIDEYLLYDFSVQEGDSINMLNPVTPFPSDGGYFILDSIISRELADGNLYRHFYFSPTPSNTVSSEDATWVEGVGSLSMINAPGGHPDINAVGHLSCFFKNGEIFYSNLDSIDNCKPVHLGLSNKQSLSKIVLYTPHNSTICVLKNTIDVTQLEVFDINGKKIQQLFNTKKTNTLTFETSGFKKGLYILKAHRGPYSKRTFKLLVK